MTVDLSKIRDLELRKKAAELYEAYAEAEEAYDACETSEEPLYREVKADLEKLEQDYYIAREALYAKMRGGALDKARKEAEDALDALEKPEIMTDFYGAAVYCAISDVLIWEDDEVLRDGITNEVILRCFAGLPPRSDEDAEEVEEAA
jgi:hypothetical protein